MNRKYKKINNIVIYQAKNGKIKFRGDFDHNTVWGTQQQIADVFEIDRSVVTKHIRNILKDGEVDEKSNVQNLHIAHSDKPVKFYSLDIILAVGYRTNSSKAILFRKWTTTVLRQHLVDGYTINKERITKSYQSFLQAVADVKNLLPKDDGVKTEDILELIKAFSSAWFSLNAYDTQKFPRGGITKKKIDFTANELMQALHKLKLELILKKEATDLFGVEKSKDSFQSIVGNIFQSFDGADLYPTIEEKAAHLLYFTIKNHPFVDGNKRNAAFAFIWFLSRAGILQANLTPEALTALTLLIATNDPKEKDKIIGLILLLLQRKPSGIIRNRKSTSV